MDTIRKQAANPLVAGIVGFVIGVLIGLVVLGWWLFPVEWENANPAALSPAWQDEYLRMSIQSYGASGDAASAQRQFTALGEAADDALTRIAQSPQGLSGELITSYSTMVTGQAVAPAQPTSAAPVQPGETPLPGATLPVLGETPAAGAPVATPEPEAEGGLSNLAKVLIGLICLVVLLIAGAIGWMVLRGGRMPQPGAAPTPAQEAMEARRQVGVTDYVSTGAEPPVEQFIASYKLGDDLFDDSFSIDSPTGEFLGECGVGISETIGVGEPKKVTAFEVWLFDKNDIQTVTKVLMSVHAFSDGTISQRLEAKGEPVQAEPGVEFFLETQTLQLSARVVDMSYGEGAMPPNSYFEHLLLELAIWQK